MSTFELVSKYVTENKITKIVIGDINWENLIKYVNKHYPDLDSEYYGNILFNELTDLNITYTFDE